MYFKKIIFIILILCFIYSCDLNLSSYDVPTYNIPIDVQFHRCKCLSTKDYQKLDCVENYIFRIIEYKSNKTYKWSEPDEVYIQGYGDCQEMGILFMWLAYQEFDIKPDSILHYKIIGPGHFMAKYKDYIFYEVDLKPDWIETYNFEETLIIAKYIK